MNGWLFQQAIIASTLCSANLTPGTGKIYVIDFTYSKVFQGSGIILYRLSRFENWKVIQGKIECVFVSYCLFELDIKLFLASLLIKSEVLYLHT